MSENEAKAAGPQPERYLALSKVVEICERIMRESEGLTADSKDYRIGQWSGAEKAKWALECEASVRPFDYSASRRTLAEEAKSRIRYASKMWHNSDEHWGCEIAERDLTYWEYIDEGIDELAAAPTAAAAEKREG